MICRSWARAMLVTFTLACAACGATTSEPGLAAGGASGGAAADDGGNTGAMTGGADAGGGEPMFHGIPLGSACPKDSARGSFSGNWSLQIPVIRTQSFELQTPPGGNVGVLQLVLHSKSADRARIVLAVEGRLARRVI